MGIRNTIGQLSGASALLVAGSSTSGGVGTIAAPLQFAGDVVVTKTGTGTYTVVISDFLGPQGIAVPIVAAQAGIAEFSSSYSGSTLTVSVSTFSGMDATAANEAFNFIVVAL